MPLITVIIYIAIVGLIMWLVNKYVPMAEPFKTILNIVVVVALCIWLLSVFGLLGATIPIYHYRN